MIDRFYSWPIRIHLIILIALLTIPSVFLFIRSGLDQRSDAATAAKSECLDFVTFIAGRYQSMVAGSEQLVGVLALLPEIRSRNSKATNALLSELVKKNPRYANLVVADTSGFAWASAIPFEGKLSMADRKYFQDAVRTGLFSSGEYDVGKATKKPVLTFGYPVKNASNEVIAVIAIAFDLAYTQQYFEQSGFPPGASFSLLDHQGIILIRNEKDPFSQKLIGGRDTREENWTKMLEGPNEGTYESMGNDGRYRLVAYKKLILPHESKPYLYVRSSIPLASATAKANAAMLRNLSIFGGLFLLGLVLAWFIGKRLIVRPAMLLKGAAGQLAAGADTVNVSSVVKGGELGEVARAFDGMAEALIREKTALRESERRWATTLSSIADAVIATDVEGRIAFMNVVAEEMTGWTLQDASQKPVTQVFNIINEYTREAAENPVSRVLREGQVVGLANHTVLISRDGREIAIDDSAAPIRDTAGNVTGVVLAFHDVTEKRKTEKALREVEENFRSLFQGSADAVFMAIPGGQLIEANPAACTMFGMTEEELCKAGRAGIEDPDNPAPQWALEDRARTGKVRYEAAHVRKDGSKFPTEVTSVILAGGARSIVFIRDITERKKMEEELEANRRYLEEMVHERTAALRRNQDLLNETQRISKVGGWEFDVITRRVSWTDEVYRIHELSTAYDPSSPEQDIQFYAPDDQRRIADAFQEAVARGEPYDLELQLVTAQGNRLWVRTMGQAESEGGKVVRVFGNIMDVTARKQLADQLRQSQKMEAIGTLAGGIAHDFNNILAAILGFTEMAAEDVADRPEVERNLRNVLKSAMRARELVKQILAFSRKTSHERTPLSLSSVITETVHLLRASIPSTIEITLTNTATSDTILGAPIEIQQILMNLATNASLAMQDTGGTLEVSLTDIDFAPESPVLGPDVIPGEYLQLLVKDTGIGMTPDVMKRVFEPFFTTREVGKGTGMGLAVVYGIVKDLQGTITVESTPGVGSTFRVFLPKVKTEQKEDQPQTAQIPGGTERILFLDDEDMLVEWGETVLERLGYQVTALTDSIDVLKTFSSDPTQFDLVITDQTMPGIPGLQLSKELLKIRPDIPIILCTGHSDTVSPETAKKAGIREFLMKPLVKQELAQVVRRVLDKRSEG